MTRLFLDIETYCETPIKAGTHRYAEGVEIILFAYAFDEEPAAVIDLTAQDSLPQRVLDAFNDPAVELWAHNSHFDRTMLKRFYPEVADPRRWRDTMILAYAHSLPGSLGELCEILGLPTDKAKDKDGRRLVQLFCSPRPEYSQIHRATAETHPDDWEHFCDYCRLDVEAMREVWHRLPKWNSENYGLWPEWSIDQDINDRGMAIDLQLVDEAIKAADADKARANDLVYEATDGAVSTIGQRDEFLKHILSAYGVSLPDMQKSTLERRLNDESLPIQVHDLIALRLETGKTSVQKYKALQTCTSSDGRLRGCLQFMGAIRTGRWTGRLFQPQNLPRGSLKPAEVEAAIEAIKAGVVDLMYENVTSTVSSCIRGAIIAPKGKKLVVADLSNIEGRVLAWTAGEEWKLEAFRAFDRGEGPDLYKATYARTFGIKPEEVTKPQRQIGKVLELSLGYQGGVPAFLNFASIYGLDLDELAVHTREAIEPKFWHEAADAYEWFKSKGLTVGLKPDTFIACEAIKRAWRSAHPAIVNLWSKCDEGSRSMAAHGKGCVRAGKVLLGRKSAGYGALLLPSGRYVCYPGAREAKPDERATFVYYGINQYTRKWSEIRSYGGKVVENACQAIARDVLASTMPAIEAAGYKVVLSVHDELITECPDTPEYSAEHLSRLMSTAPAWASDLPLAAAGFEAYRYKKD